MHRRSFLHSLAATLAVSPLTAIAAVPPARAELGFSTLGCPSWDWITILDFAAKHGFASIELRGLQASMDLTERPEFQPQRIERSKQDRQYVLTGEGDIPVKRQVQLLAKSGYTGCYSLEWEKRWHPEIPEPEVAFPHFARVVREYLS